MSCTPVYTIYRYAADWTYAYIDMLNITATHHSLLYHFLRDFSKGILYEVFRDKTVYSRHIGIKLPKKISKTYCNFISNVIYYMKIIRNAERKE